MFAQPQVQFRGAQTVAVASHGSDENLHVEFYTDAVHLEAQSREAGRPVYEDRVFIKIIVPGGKSTVVREAKYKPEHRQEGEPLDSERFAAQWRQFENQQEQVGKGTPLQEWSYLTKSQVMELKAMRIHTVDQLAAMPDTALWGLGARDMRDRAQAFLDQAKGSDVVSHLQTQLEDAMREIAALKAQMNPDGDEAPKPRRGRPPKED